MSVHKPFTGRYTRHYPQLWKQIALAVVRPHSCGIHELPKRNSFRKWLIHNHAERTVMVNTHSSTLTFHERLSVEQLWVHTAYVQPRNTHQHSRPQFQPRPIQTRKALHSMDAMHFLKHNQLSVIFTQQPLYELQLSSVCGQITLSTVSPAEFLMFSVMTTLAHFCCAEGEYYFFVLHVMTPCC